MWWIRLGITPERIVPGKPEQNGCHEQCYNGEFVLESIPSLIAAVRVFFRSRSDAALEIIALRQQVAVLMRKRSRPTLNSLARLFWTTLRRLWSRWTDVLVIVKPETVIGWHRSGFRLYWRLRSRGGGRRVGAKSCTST